MSKAARPCASSSDAPIYRRKSRRTLTREETLRQLWHRRRWIKVGESSLVRDFGQLVDRAIEASPDVVVRFPQREPIIAIVYEYGAWSIYGLVDELVERQFVALPTGQAVDELANDYADWIATHIGLRPRILGST